MLSLPVILLRLCVALVLGTAIGIEREGTEQNAGLRTNALVALGTALFTIISATGFSDLLGKQHIQIDPTRIASYVVAGIGFLGGGAIFFQQDIRKVRGLTTAAAVWMVAAIGMACGAGLLIEAAIATVLTLLVLVGMRYVERFLWPNNMQHLQLITLEVEKDHGGQLLGQVYDLCTRENLLIERVEMQTAAPEKPTETLILSCRSTDPRIFFGVINEIKTLPGVHAAHGDVRKASLREL